MRKGQITTHHDRPWPYTEDGFLNYDDPTAMDPARWVLHAHPDFVAAFEGHRQNTTRGLARTMEILERRGWIQSRKVPGSGGFITGWSSSDLAEKHETRNAWMSPAHYGAFVRLATDEPVVSDDDPRFADIRFVPPRVRRMRFETSPVLRGKRRIGVRRSAVPCAGPYLFADQPLAVRRQMARRLPLPPKSSPWHEVVMEHLGSTKPKLHMALTFPIPSVWATAIDRLLIFAGMGPMRDPAFAFRLRKAARMFERKAERIANHPPELFEDAGRRNMAIEILRDGGRDAESAVLLAQRRERNPVIPDMAMIDVYAALAEEATALDASVAAYFGNLARRH